MEIKDLLANPIFQSAIAPLAVALLAGLVMNRVCRRWTGLIVVLGFFVTAWLITDLQLQPLTSTRKVLILSMLVVPIAIILDLLPSMTKHFRRYQIATLIIAGTGAILWVIWAVLKRKEGVEQLQLASGAIFYVVLLLLATNNLKDRPLSASISILMLGIVGSISAVISATALYGQLIAAIAASTGGFILLGLFTKHFSAGAVLTFPSALIVGLLTFGAYVFARLPWYSLPLIAAIPLFAQIPVTTFKSQWLQAVIQVLVILPVAAVAIIMAMYAAGENSY